MLAMTSECTKSKKQTKDESIINSLPSDLIERIFLTLPVSTLLRCTQVCKTWYRTVRDQQFVTSHLQQAPTCTLLFFRQESVSKRLYPSDAIIFDEAWSRSIWAVPVIGPDDFLCGSCNGLLCIYTKASTIKIANFTTGECLHLEKPVKNLRGDHFSHYSFGFHPVTKEYKVTHILGDNGTNALGTFSVIQVYTLGSERWRDVRTPAALSLISVKNYGVVSVDGTMYWMLNESTEAGWQQVVMSFDLGQETFARIQLPAAALEGSAVANSRPLRYWITEIDGKLCAVAGQGFHHQPRMLAGKLRIWTLDSVHEQRWSQKYNIQYAPTMQIPLGPNFINRNKIVTQDVDFMTLYTYELYGKECDTKLRNIAELLNYGPRKANMHAYICVKSLVRLDRYEKGGIVRRPKRRGSWELKKWEEWEREICRSESIQRDVDQLEDVISEFAHLVAKRINQVLPLLPDEMQFLGPEMNQIVQTCPPQDQPRCFRRPNWVEQKEFMDNVLARLCKLREKMTAITEAKTKVFDVLNGFVPDQGTLSSNAGIASQLQ